MKRAQSKRACVLGCLAIGAVSLQAGNAFAGSICEVQNGQYVENDSRWQQVMGVDNDADGVLEATYQGCSRDSLCTLINLGNVVQTIKSIFDAQNQFEQGAFLRLICERDGSGQNVPLGNFLSDIPRLGQIAFGMQESKTQSITTANDQSSSLPADCGPAYHQRNAWLHSALSILVVSKCGEGFNGISDALNWSIDLMTAHERGNHDDSVKWLSQQGLSQYHQNLYLARYALETSMDLHNNHEGHNWAASHCIQSTPYTEFDCPVAYATPFYIQLVAPAVVVHSTPEIDSTANVGKLVYLGCSDPDDLNCDGWNDEGLHCGAANATCADQEVCCPSGESGWPAERCSDLNYDFHSCGSCFMDCATMYNTATACCDGICLNFFWDNDNCGACGNVCGAGQSCVNGSCDGSIDWSPSLLDPKFKWPGLISAASPNHFDLPDLSDGKDYHVRITNRQTERVEVDVEVCPTERTGDAALAIVSQDGTVLSTVNRSGAQGCERLQVTVPPGAAWYVVVDTVGTADSYLGRFDLKMIYKRQVLLVGDMTNRQEQILADYLTGRREYLLDIVRDTDVRASWSFERYDIMILTGYSPEVATDALQSMGAAGVPLFVVEYRNFAFSYRLGLISRDSGFAGDTSLTAVNAAHPIAIGLPEAFDVYSPRASAFGVAATSLQQGITPPISRPARAAGVGIRRRRSPNCGLWLERSRTLHLGCPAIVGQRDGLSPVVGCDPEDPRSCSRTEREAR